MRRQRVFDFRLLGVAIAAGVLWCGQAIAQQAPAAVIVYDSSFSMWGQIEGENKVVTLREELTEAFKAGQDKLRLGLVTYGHEANDSCQAIKTVMPLSMVEGGKHGEALAGTGPAKGATPIAKALEEAAGLAGYEAQPASIILISDGLDNCQADPCAMAQTLRSRSTSLRIHVIAFDRLRRNELKSLSCIAQETEGKFYSASDRGELKAALGEVMSMALAHGPVPGAGAPAPIAATGAGDAAGKAGQPGNEAGPTDAPPAAPAQAQQASPAELVSQQAAAEQAAPSLTLRLAASLTKDSGLLKDGLVWRVFASQPDEEGNFHVVARNDGAEGVFTLRPGTYIVHVAYGRANSTREIALTDKNYEETIVINAGGLRLKAAIPGDTAIPDDTINYAIYSSEQDQFGQRKLILPSVPAGKIVRLNAGSYHIISQFGDANAIVRADVEVKPGQLSDATVNHEAARITLKLVNEPGGEALANTSWSILNPEGEVISESVGAFPSHILAAGDYSVLARHEGNSYNKTFSVQTGINSEIELVAQ